MTQSGAEACRMKLQKMEGGIHGIDLTVTAHAEKEDAETLIEPDIGGTLDLWEFGDFFNILYDIHMICV